MPSRRRSRFTGTHKRTGEQTVLLAYGLNDARRWFGKNFTVKAGDWTIKPAKGGGWTLSRRKLIAAAKELGLSYPVVVKQTSREGEQRGAYRLKPGPLHSITVKSYLTPKQATMTLWHELAHARQAELSGTASGWRATLRDENRTPYWRRPIEVEARRLAELNAHKMLTY